MVLTRSILRIRGGGVGTPSLFSLSEAYFFNTYNQSLGLMDDGTRMIVLVLVSSLTPKRLASSLENPV